MLLAAALAAVTATVLAERPSTLIADPGAVVRVLDPALSATANLAAALTIGTLVLAAVAIPVTSPAATSARRLATAGGVVWTLAAVAGLVTTWSLASGTPVTDPRFGAGLQLFLTSFDLGRYLLASALLAAAATTVAAAATGPTGTAGAALLALCALVPAALSGHSGSAADHETATTSLGLHLVGTAVWVGGLAAVGVLFHRLRAAERAPVAHRYGFLALVSAGLVAGSGLLNAGTRVAGLEDLGTRYGVLLAAKAVLTVLLLGAGVLHRRHALRGLAAGRSGAFRALLLGEALVMAGVVGVAVALSTTVPPVSDTQTPTSWSPAEALVGYPAPPPPDLVRWLTGWQPDVLWLVVASAAALGYLAGVYRLRRRGDRWPVLRTAAFLTGIALLVWVTSGGPSVYGRWTFSAHMVQHMVLAMFVPIPLVVGAPVLLAMRTLRPRTDGSRGAREWLLAAVHSRFAAFQTHPVVAGLLFAVGMSVFYFSPLFDAALSSHLGHELMMVHFLASGFLFVWVLIGVDPGARRAPYPFRLVLLFATMAYHALFGVALLQGTSILAEDHFAVSTAGLPWADPLLADQRTGASLAWALGEIPMLVLAVAIAVLWAAADSREARRRDRQADRDGDAARDAYNAYLGRLAATPEAARSPARSSGGADQRTFGTMPE
jgi:putative copper resistance protein D